MNLSDAMSRIPKPQHLAIVVSLAWIVFSPSVAYANDGITLNVWGQGDEISAEGNVRHYQATPVPDSTSAVQGPVFVVGDGIEVGVSSADEWNRALEECLAHAANGPILLQQCRIILGLEHPQTSETPDPDTATSTAPSVESLSPRQIINYAHAQHTINGAGLAWQPKTNALVGLPTLVHVTSPTQNATLSLFGQSISIALEASHFSYDFGDNTPTLETTDPSAPYPVQTLNHVYTETSPGRIITLTTTWNATITYPSGRSVYLANALTSTESSTPITILRATISLVPSDK